MSCCDGNIDNIPMARWRASGSTTTWIPRHGVPPLLSFVVCRFTSVISTEVTSRCRSKAGSALPQRLALAFGAGYNPAVLRTPTTGNTVTLCTMFTRGSVWHHSVPLFDERQLQHRED